MLSQIWSWYNRSNKLCQKLAFIFRVLSTSKQPCFETNHLQVRIVEILNLPPIFIVNVFIFIVIESWSWIVVCLERNFLEFHPTKMKWTVMNPSPWAKMPKLLMPLCPSCLTIASLNAKVTGPVIRCFTATCSHLLKKSLCQRLVSTTHTSSCFTCAVQNRPSTKPSSIDYGTCLKPLLPNSMFGKHQLII